MTITEMIEKLEALKLEHGDLEVFDKTDYSQQVLSVVELDMDEFLNYEKYYGYTMPKKFLCLDGDV